MRNSSVLILLAGLLTGCVSDIPSQFDHATVRGVGLSKTDLVSRLGIPSRTMKIDDTITTLQWDSDQGISSVGHVNGTTVGTAYGQSQRYLDGETDAGAVGSSMSMSESKGNVTTHVCAYSANIDNTSNKVVSAGLVGTVDNKCYEHFKNMLTLDNQAVAKHNEIKMHDENVHDYAAWWLLMPVGGLFVALHNHHVVPNELEPVH